MRISTTQFYEVTTQNYQRNYANVVKTGEEVSSGIKLNTASDDPVGAARVLQLQQQNSMLTQYKSNIGIINTNTVNTETALTSLVSSMQKARELIVAAGNGSYTDADRKSTANELQQLQNEILGLMNTQDSNGQYIFSGSKSSTVPYSMNADGTYTYNGNQTTMDLAVGDGLKLASNTTGFEAFEKAVNTTRTSSTVTNGANDGKVGLSSGLVTSTSTYNASFQAGEPYSLEFTSATQFSITDKNGNDVTTDTSTNGVFSYSTSDNQAFTFRGVQLTMNVNLSTAEKADAASAAVALGVGTADVRTFAVASTPDSITTSRSPGNSSTATITGAAVGTSAADKTAYNNAFPASGAILRYDATNGYELYASPYTAGNTPVATGAVSGTAPNLVVNAAGVNFTLDQTPDDGDVFVVQSGTHQTENVLNTLSAVIKALNTPTTGDLVASQALNSALTSALGNMTSSIEQASTANSAGGSRQNAAEAQGTTNDLLLGNNEVESGSIVNTDIVEATTRLTMQQTMLQASQMVFTQLSKLSLFSQM
jgi:flagellar hook-associated protein 3 FlgL